MSTTDAVRRSHPAPSPRLSMPASAPLPAGRRPRRAFLRRAARLAGRFTLDAVEVAAIAAFTIVAFFSVAIVLSGGPS